MFLRERELALLLAKFERQNRGAVYNIWAHEASRLLTISDTLRMKPKQATATTTVSPIVDMYRKGRDLL